VLRGGEGDDSLTDLDPTGVDELNGGPGNDAITGGPGPERVVQAGDVDQVLMDDSLTGLGTDTLLAVDEARLSGGGGDNDLDASGFSEGPVVLEGLAGADTLLGGSEDDRLVGGTGSDSYPASREPFGTDSIVEAAACEDVDQIDLGFLPAAVTLDVGKTGPQAIGEGTFTLPAETAMEGARGTAFDDTITGSSCRNQLFGGAGTDSLLGLGEADTLVGQDGADTLDGGDGVDTVAQTADTDQTLTDERLTGEGPDSFVSMERASLAGGSGQNRLDASAFTGGSVSLFGGGGNDSLLGGGFADLLLGQGGNDEVVGSDGDDVLKGEEGDDSLEGERGSDRLAAGSGNDAVSGGPGNDRANGSEGNDRADGGTGDDRVSGGSDRDRLVGSAGKDRLTGGSDADQLRARDGERDVVSGGSGKDRAVADPHDVLRKVEKGSPGRGGSRFPAAAREIMASRSTER
jgi:Ca2+-binding RTX toxin-like protein